MKIFISYSLDDKNEAGILHGLLSLLGFECFLAHRDIRKGDKWRDVIVDELKASNVFVPILSDSGLSSAWVHQECGMAHLLQVNKKKLRIIPVIVDNVAPPGCLGVYQAMSVRLKFLGFGRINLNHDVAKSLAHEIIKKTDCLREIKGATIKNVGHANLYDAEYLLGFLSETRNVLFDDLLLLIKQCASNQKIIHSANAMAHMCQFVALYRAEISKHPESVKAWNGIYKRYQNYIAEQRREMDKAMKRLEDIVQNKNG